MSNTNALTNEGNAGSPRTTPAMPAMKPWDIAELPLFHFLASGQTVDVEHATDAQFEEWRAQMGIPAKPGAWNFERRCKAINMCRFYGTWSALKFPIEISAETSTDEQERADSAQNRSGFLEYVARAREIMRANPAIESAELAQLLGLKSKIYAHQVKVFVNAQNSPEGA